LSNIYLKNEKKKKRTSDKNLPFPSDGFLPLSSSPVRQVNINNDNINIICIQIYFWGDIVNIWIHFYFILPKGKKREKND